MGDVAKIGIKSLIDKAEISLVLDTYDDLFSDFDPRPYTVRSLSEDFLAAAKKAALDKGAGTELMFLIPKAARNMTDEELIKQRLRNHFRKHYRLIKDDASRRRKQAALLIIAGAAIGLTDVLLTSTGILSALTKDAIEIVLTPASWFTIWTGFDHLLIRPKEDTADEAFYRKMVDSQISFTPY